MLDLKLSESTQDGWLHCRNPNGMKESAFKLHISLEKHHFDEFEKQIYQLLQDAVAKGIIPSFKRLNCGNSKDLISVLGQEEKTIAEDPRTRLINNPFTIYLYDQMNHIQIIKLCQEIETILKDAPLVNPNHISIADLPLTPHITFRQEKLNDEYIQIADATPTQLTILKEQGEQSEAYNGLKLTLSEGREIPSAESEVLNFYNATYSKLSKDLDSQDARKQLQAACILLGMEENLFLKQATPKDRELFNQVHSHARSSKLRLHPDKNTTCQYAAHNLFDLTIRAEAFLKEVVEKPQLIDFKVTLKQNPKKPQHQYELADGYKDDPYFYIAMAKSNKIVLLKQYWEIKNEKHTIFYQDQTEVIEGSSLDEKKIESEENISKPLIESTQVLAVYESKIHYFDEPRTIKLPAHEAFFHLFISGALPQRFDQGHLRMALDRYAGYERVIAQPQLLKKMLTTLEFICFLDSQDLNDYAIKATQQGIIDIGLTSHDVLLYYFKNYPETLYARRIEKFVGNKDFNASVFIKEIISLENRHLLYHLWDGAIDSLVVLDQSLCQLVFNDQLLFKKMSSYFWEYQVVEPFIKKSKFDDYCKGILKNILLQREPDLSPLSISKIKEFLSFLETNKFSIKNRLDVDIPNWAIEFLNVEISKRKESLSSPELSKTFMSTDDYIQIKKEILKKDNLSIFSYLDKPILALLSDDPDIHWSYYPEIIENLPNDAKELSNNLSNSLRKQLIQASPGIQIDENFPLNTKKIADSKEIPEILIKSRSKFKKEKFDSLSQEFIKNLTSNPINKDKIEKIKNEFYMYGFEIDKLYKRTEKEIDSVYRDSFEKLLRGGITEENKEQIRKDIHAYCDAYKALRDYAVDGPFESILGNDTYLMMSSIIQGDRNGSRHPSGRPYYTLMAKKRHLMHWKNYFLSMIALNNLKSSMKVLD